MNATRTIGGSILPSSDPRILQPLPFRAGNLCVRPLVQADTHALILITATGESLLATHPNGYSCRSLAECMVTGNVIRVREQAEYILRCGGTVPDVAAICELLN